MLYKVSASFFYAVANVTLLNSETVACLPVGKCHHNIYLLKGSLQVRNFWIKIINYIE